MKKSLLVISLLGFAIFLITGCNNQTKNSSPSIAYIEVLDENHESLKDCTFTATYNGNAVEGLYFNYYEYSDEEFKNYCEGSDHIAEYINGKTGYEIGSLFYSDLVDSGTSIEAMYSNSSFSVSKDGYKTQTFTLSVDTSKTQVARKSVVLEKISE